MVMGVCSKCVADAYNFAINVGKAMRELHLAEEGKLGLPGAPLELARLGIDQLEKCIPIPKHTCEGIKKELVLAKERVERKEFTLGRLALEAANDHLFIAIMEVLP